MKQSHPFKIKSKTTMTGTKKAGVRTKTTGITTKPLEENLKIPSTTMVSSMLFQKF